MHPHPARLAGKVVFVTGASTGIGQASAHWMAAEGATLFLADINQTDLDTNVATLRENGHEVSTAAVDVRSDDDVAAAVAACVTEFGRIDGVANIAGVQTWANSHEMTTEAFRRDIEVNLMGSFIVCREAIPHLLETGGAIVNMCSTTAHAGIPYSVAYSASKGGVLAMTRSLAIEYAKKGLRVNCVSPGSIQTAMSDNPPFPDDPDWKLLMRQSSLQGFGVPDDIAVSVAMLLSDDGRHINGQNLTIDGASIS